MNASSKFVVGKMGSLVMRLRDGCAICTDN